jgi:hypothetical protein
MPDDDPGHCAICKISFLDADETDEDERVVTCTSCYQLSHVGCTVTHGCPCRGPSDQEKLKAWNVGVRGW